MTYCNCFYLFLIILVLWTSVQSQEIKNKICTQNYDRDACQQISRDGEFACTEDTRSMVDCFLNLDQGLPQIAIVKPEEALLAAPLVSEKIVVIGEVFTEHTPFQTAVIVRKSYSGGFENLKGKRLCHPGFKHDELVSRLILEELESKVISLNSSYCDTGDNSTIVEKRIRALANFFGPSCRPGTWTESSDLDNQLKSKYSSLCELCGTAKCSVSYQVPFNESLLCLQNSGGDVAITTLNDGQAFFKTSTNTEQYQYLCSDGTVSDSPCTWTNQINRLIVTESESVTTMKSFIENKLSSYVSAFLRSSVSADNYLAALEKVLGLDKSDKINLNSSVSSLKTYVEAQRAIPSISSSKQCDLSVKWCTLNNKEQAKCQWLQQAGLNSAIQPVVECVQSSDTDALSCLNDIKQRKVDIAYTDVNYGYIALKKGLAVVAYPETDTRQLSSILIVVKANRTEDIKSLSDLKGKSACFPEYGGKEWLAFIDTLKNKNIIENSCDYGHIFSDFVGMSCVPAANSNDYGIDNADTTKLCAQCIPVNNTLTASYCNADDGNKYYSTDGALRCILDQAGEYAVITKNDVNKYVDTASDFRVISKNGSLSQFTGFNVDENAPLTIITAGGVVAKASNQKKDDIVLLLRAIESEFGQNLKKTFKVFESFNGTTDLLFPDSTPGLTFGGSSIHYVDNFKMLLSNSEKCVQENTSGAFSNIASTVLLFVLSLVGFRF